MLSAGYLFVILGVLCGVGGCLLGGEEISDKLAGRQKLDDAMAKMEEGLRLGDHASLDAAEKALEDCSRDANPRVEAVGNLIVVRSRIWFAFTGEELLMSDSRKCLAYLAEPLAVVTGALVEAPYMDEPMTHVAGAVYKAAYDQQDEALTLLDKRYPLSPCPPIGSPRHPGEPERTPSGAAALRSGPS